MTEFETNLKSVEPFINGCAIRVMKRSNIELQDAAQIIRMRLWSHYKKHADLYNNENVDPIVMMKHIAFNKAKSIVSKEYRKSEFRNSIPKEMYFEQEITPDFSATIINKLTVEEFMNLLPDRYKVLCILIQYCDSYTVINKTIGLSHYGAQKIIKALKEKYSYRFGYN